MRRPTREPAAGLLAVLGILTACALLAAGPKALAARAPVSDADDALSIKRHYFVLNGLRRVAGQWGELRVAENPGNPHSRQIKVTFGRMPGTGEAAGAPIFFVAGGPGASGIGSFAGNAEWLLPLRRFGDVVLVEQRGTGFSRPRLDCAEHWELPVETPLERSRLIEVARRQFAACRRTWQAEGVDLAGYNTVAYADDVIAVANALGYRQFTVIAFSYGTQIALELLRSHSRRLSRVVLLGVMGPSDSLRNPIDHDAVLDRAAELLRHDEASDIYPDLVVSTAETIAMLRRAPVRVSVTDPEDGEPVEFVYDELAYRRQMVTRLGIREELAKLPRFNHALLAGTDREWLQSELHTRLRGLLWMRKGPLAMRSAAQHYATVCAAADPAPRERVPPDCVLGHTFHPALPEACDAWQVPNLGDEFREPPRSDVPVLMFSGDLDTKTPVQQAERLLPYLRNARHVILVNAGHDDLLEVGADVRERMHAFFAGQAVSAAPIVLDPIRFSMPSGHGSPCGRDDCPWPAVSSPFAGFDSAP